MDLILAVIIVVAFNLHGNRNRNIGRLEGFNEAAKLTFDAMLKLEGAMELEKKLEQEQKPKDENNHNNPGL